MFLFILLGLFHHADNILGMLFYSCSEPIELLAYPQNIGNSGASIYKVGASVVAMVKWAEVQCFFCGGNKSWASPSTCHCSSLDLRGITKSCETLTWKLHSCIPPWYTNLFICHISHFDVLLFFHPRLASSLGGILSTYGDGNKRSLTHRLDIWQVKDLGQACCLVMELHL